MFSSGIGGFEPWVVYTDFDDSGLPSTRRVMVNDRIRRAGLWALICCGVAAAIAVPSYVERHGHSESHRRTAMFGAVVEWAAFLELWEAKTSRTAGPTDLPEIVSDLVAANPKLLEEGGMRIHVSTDLKVLRSNTNPETTIYAFQSRGDRSLLVLSGRSLNTAEVTATSSQAMGSAAWFISSDATLVRIGDALTADDSGPEPKKD